MSFEYSHSRGETTIAIQNLLEQIERGENLLVAKQQVITVAYGRLRILARKMLASFNRVELDEETDGLIAESYLRLNKSLDEMRPENVRQFFALAALQMRRQLLDKLRHVRGRGEEERPQKFSLEQPNSSHPHQADLADSASSTPNWTSLDVLAALDKIDDRERECLILQNWYNFSHAEIAKLLQVSTKTVQRLSNSAYLQLAEILKSYNPVQN